MSGPTASPRPERPGTPGTRWETVLRPVEVVVADDAPDPTPNRAARRAAARAARRQREPSDATDIHHATPDAPQERLSGA